MDEINHERGRFLADAAPKNYSNSFPWNPIILYLWVLWSAGAPYSTIIGHPSLVGPNTSTCFCWLSSEITFNNLPWCLFSVILRRGLLPLSHFSTQKKGSGTNWFKYVEQSHVYTRKRLDTCCLLSLPS